MAQTVKNPPAVQETQVQSLGPVDAMEKGMATHSSFLAWKIPGIEEPGRLQSMASQRIRHNQATDRHAHNKHINEYQSHVSFLFDAFLNLSVLNDSLECKNFTSPVASYLGKNA